MTGLAIAEPVMISPGGGSSLDILSYLKLRYLRATNVLQRSLLSSSRLRIFALQGVNFPDFFNAFTRIILGTQQKNRPSKCPAGRISSTGDHLLYFLIITFLVVGLHPLNPVRIKSLIIPFMLFAAIDVFAS